MVGLTVYLASLLIVCAVALLAAVSDFRGMTIPNHHSAIIAGGFVFCSLILHFTGHPPVWPPFFSGVLAGLLFFAISFALFAAKILGAGDSKFGTVCALWMGLGGFPAFLFYMTIFGGILALVSMGLKKWKPLKNPPAGSWLERAQQGDNKVPYGIAIFLGMLASLLNLGYFEYETFASFLPG